MANGTPLTAFSLRPPYHPNTIVDITTGMSSDEMDRYLRDLTTVIRSIDYTQMDQANIAKFTTQLGRQDTGVLIWVPTFNHILRWTGVAWQFAPGDTGSGYVATFFFDPPNADGWALCDGSNVTFLKSDGTTGTALLPNTPGLYFRR